MIAGVADTHAPYGFYPEVQDFQATAKESFDSAATARKKIVLSPISLAEIVYRAKKNRLPASAFDEVKTALRNPNQVLEESPFTAEVVEAMRKVSREAVPDMQDRIVLAAAVLLAFHSSAATERYAPRMCRLSCSLFGNPP